MNETKRKPEYPDLAGKHVLVTGGGSGIGLAVALAFARNRCRISLFDISPEALANARVRLRDAGYEAHVVAGTVTRSSETEAAIDACETAMGGLDVLINNAGVSGNVPALELSDEHWRRILGVNLDGAFYFARAAGRRMCARNSGSIVNMSSMYGLVAAPDRTAYCVSKSGITMLTKTIAIEWAGRGVRVNAVAPGYIQTRLVDELVERGSYDLAAIRRRTPLGRLGTPYEVADATVFLASDCAAFITGHVLTIDGGWSSYGYL